jgi:hypothetical protein
MLFDPSRHEALQTIAWNEDRVREAIAWVVELTERHYHPRSCGVPTRATWTLATNPPSPPPAFASAQRA